MRKMTVHSLVAEAFIGKRPRGKVVNHKDMDKLNNRAENLEWVTLKQNARHAVKNGRTGGPPPRGEKSPNAKLTATQVCEIRRQQGRAGQRVLAARYGVSKTTIQKIHQGKTWAAEL